MNKNFGLLNLTRKKAGAVTNKKNAGGGSSKREPSLLEDAFVDLVIEMSRNDTELYNKAWPNKPSPDRKWGVLTQKEGKAPRQYLRLEDAYRMSVGLGKPFTHLIALALERVEERAASEGDSAQTRKAVPE